MLLPLLSLGKNNHKDKRHPISGVAFACLQTFLTVYGALPDYKISCIGLDWVSGKS